MKKYLEKNKGFLNVRAIERECGIPQGLLAKVASTDTELPPKHIPKLLSFLKKLGDVEYTPVLDSEWVKVDSISKYARGSDGVYSLGGKRFKTKFSGGFWVKEV